MAVFKQRLAYVIENESMRRLLALDDRLENVLEIRMKYCLLRKGSVTFIMSFAFLAVMLLT